jgi:hypothetical protein
MTVSVIDLWAAILLSGLLCWVASSLVHMLFKYHARDYRQLTNEEDVLAVLRKASLPPAIYTMPYCHDMKEMGDAKMQKKFNDGPVAILTVMSNGMPPMGKLLGQQVVFFILGSALIAYLLTMSIAPGAAYISVFHQVFVIAFLTYGWAQIPYSIWMGQPWSNCCRYLIDAVIYAGATAGAFAGLWP